MGGKRYFGVFRNLKFFFPRVFSNPYHSYCTKKQFRVVELLPSTPEGVQVDVVSESVLNVTWDKPTRNSASITEYAVNVTMLKSFDNNPVFNKNIEDQNSSWIIVTPHSVQVKVGDRVVIIKSAIMSNRYTSSHSTGRRNRSECSHS